MILGQKQKLIDKPNHAKGRRAKHLILRLRRLFKDWIPDPSRGGQASPG